MGMYGLTCLLYLPRGKGRQGRHGVRNFADNSTHDHNSYIPTQIPEEDLSGHLQSPS